MRKTIAALALALSFALAAPIAHAEPSQARQAAAARQCRDAGGHFVSCGQAPAGSRLPGHPHKAKGQSGKLAPAQAPTYQARRTLRCDGKGPLKRPTSRPCANAFQG